MVIKCWYIKDDMRAFLVWLEILPRDCWNIIAMTDLGDLHHFLGISVTRTSDGLFLMRTRPDLPRGRVNSICGVCDIGDPGI